MKRLFQGVGVALVTPFLKNKIDYQSMQTLIEKCISDGASAIIILATTGEAATISQAERKQIILFCKNLISNRAKLIVGTGNNNFVLCKKFTQQAKLLGADGCLVVTPYYNKTTQAGLIKFYSELEKIKIPLIMYNVPARTGLNLELATIQKIIKTNKYVFGIKESTCDINRIIKLHQLCHNKIAIYSGEDDLNYLFYCLGGDGTISVTANAFCSQVKKVFDYTKTRHLSSALNQQTKLSKINHLLFCETNPSPIKFALSELGLIASGEVRMPLVQLQTKNKIAIRKEIKRL